MDWIPRFRIFRWREGRRSSLESDMASSCRDRETVGKPFAAGVELKRHPVMDNEGQKGFTAAY
jgi:hypothetical protein